MLTRIRDLIIVVGTLAPFIAFAVIGIATVVAAGSIKASGEQYGADVKTQLSQATRAFRDVGSALDDVGVFVTGITDSVDRAVAGIGEISPEVLPTAPVQIPRTRLVDLPTVFGFHLPAVDFPATTVLAAGALDFTVRGVEPIGDFFDDVARVGGEISSDLERELGSMFAVPEPIDEIAKKTSALASDVRSTANVWLMVTLITLVVTAAAWLVNRVGLVMSEVKRGWSMLLGRKAPAVNTVAQMRARLHEMEAQLATLDV